MTPSDNLQWRPEREREIFEKSKSSFSLTAVSKERKSWKKEGRMYARSSSTVPPPALVHARKKKEKERAKRGKDKDGGKPRLVVVVAARFFPRPAVVENY